MMRNNLIFCVLLMSVLLISFSAYNLFDSPKRVAGKYVEIMSDEGADPAIKAEELYKIISLKDQNILNEMSNVFVTRDAKIWSEYLSKNTCKYAFCDWFNKGVQENIQDTTSFRNLVLADVISFESANFSGAEYLETKNSKRPLKQIIYTKKLSNTLAISRPVHVFTYEGNSEVVLHSRIKKLNQDMRKATKWRGRNYYENPVTFALNALN